MILQNKKTGVLGVLEATTYHGGRPDNIIEVYEMGMGAVKVLAQYKTLEELLEEWEDAPKEPLIKDEKIRKAVRAWAEVNSIKKALYAERPDRSLCLLNDMGEDDYNIDFVGWIPTLKDGEEYTIDELCGEKE